MVGARRQDRDGDGRRRSALRAAPAGCEDGRQRQRRGPRRRLRRLRRRRRRRDRRADPGRRGAAAAPLRDRRRRGVGCRPAVRRRDRRLGPGLRAGALCGDRARPAAAPPRSRCSRAPRPARSCSSRPTARARGRSDRPRSTTRRRAPRASCCGPRSPSAARRCSSTSCYPTPRLILFGAVDVAASLCTLARAAGWRPYVVDPRARFATPERFPDAEEVIVAWPEEAFARLGGIDRGDVDRGAHPRPEARRRRAR